MTNWQTDETAILYKDSEESRFNYMIVVNGAGHELGYWEPYEWERDGWKIKA